MLAPEIISKKIIILETSAKARSYRYERFLPGNLWMVKLKLSRVVGGSSKIKGLSHAKYEEDP